jgi:hypothetical protein
VLHDLRARYGRRSGRQSPAAVALICATLAAALVLGAVGADGVAAGSITHTSLAASRLTPGATATSASTTPTFPPVWLRVPRAIAPGSSVVLVLDPVSAVSCQLALRGPRRAQEITRHIAGGGAIATIKLQTRRRAAPGAWSAIATCREPTGQAQVSHATLNVNGRAGPGGMLVGPRDITIRRRALFGGHGAAGRVQGRGAGTNPFDPRQCTWWAFAKRADVYEEAVKAGVPRGGLAPHPAFGED